MVVILLLAAFPLLGVALSPLEASDDGETPRLMRRHLNQDHPVGMQLGSGGELIEDAGNDEIDWQNMCNLDFPFGKDDTNECADPTKHTIIEQETMCVMAGQQHGVSVGHDDFNIPEADWENRPRGCFAAPCTKHDAEVGDKVKAFYKGSGQWNTADIVEDKDVDGFFTVAWQNGAKDDLKHKAADMRYAEDKKCFYYNSFGEVPKNPKGTPVCQRPKFMNGTDDSNGGCPDGYQVIMNENNCSEAATCLGYCQDAAFRIGESNKSKYFEYPLGCFVHNEDLPGEAPCVAFNPAVAAWSKPTSPKGQPVCVTTHVGR